MKLSEDGANKLIAREGKKLKAYKDTKGILTIGVGHTGPEVRSGLVWTEAQVLEAFQKDVKWAETAVNSVSSPLQQHQFDALVSFVFNVGVAAWHGSTMKRLLNAKKYSEAAKQFDLWHKPKEIIGRRDSEKQQFEGK